MLCTSRFERAGRRCTEGRTEEEMARSSECAGNHLKGHCVGPAVLRCGSCGAVRYCSREHQKAHWSEHEDACRRMAEQMQRAAYLHDFPFTFTLETTQLVDMGAVTSCSFLGSHGLHGQGMWQAECDCASNEASLSGMARRSADWHLPSSMCPCTDPASSVGLLRDWSEYYSWRQLPIDSPVALLLHWPLTLYHALRLLESRSSWTLPAGCQQSLHVHYLGPERELDQLAVFGELLALLPGVQVYIDLIGPAVPTSRDGELLELEGYAMCLDVDCPCKTRRPNPKPCGDSLDGFVHGHVWVRTWKGLYHERHPELDGAPDFVLAANAGIAVFPSWQPTIDLIERMRVPAFFTDYCEEAATMAAQSIALTHAEPLTFPYVPMIFVFARSSGLSMVQNGKVQVNPFRQPLTPRNKVLDLPTFSNAFILGLN